MAGLRDVVFTGIFLFFLTPRISSNSSKSMSVWLFYLFHFHTFEDKINTCSRSGHRIITCCRYIQDNYRRLIYRVPSSAFSLRSLRCCVTAASSEESGKLLIWQHCAASPAESWEVISHNFNKQYKQKNEQHIMIISWVTEIHAEKFSLPCNITKWVLHLYNLSAPLRCASSVRFSQRWCRLGRWKFLKTQKPQFKVSLVLLCFYSLKFLLLNSTNNNRNSSKQI